MSRIAEPYALNNITWIRDSTIIMAQASGLRDEVQPYRNSIVIYEESLVPGITYYRGKMINAMHGMTFEEVCPFQRRGMGISLCGISTV